jgi:flagellin-like hook-associated protein FlgL
MGDMAPKSLRSAPLHLRQVSDLMAQSGTSVAANNRYNPLPNNPLDFSTSTELSTLNSLLDGMSRGITTIRAAGDGIAAITKLVQLALALVSQAQKTTDTNVRARLVDQFNALLPQINQVTADANFNGINLLEGGDLRIITNQHCCPAVSVTAFHATVSGDLAITKPKNTWATNFEIQATADNLNLALVYLRSQAQSLSDTLSTIQIREHFIKTMINTLRTGGDWRTPADSNKESANLLALQTRQQLSNITRWLATQAEQNVLRLLWQAD